MIKGDESRHRATKWIRRVARIWSLPIIVYTLLLFVGYGWSWMTTGVADPHAVEDSPAIEALSPVLMFLGILGLAIAWRWERWGGTIAIAFQAAALLSLLILKPIARDFPRSGIPYLLWVIVTIPGVLFLVCWWRSKKGAIPDDRA
jgi:hypothetical protein